MFPLPVFFMQKFKQLHTMLFRCGMIAFILFPALRGASAIRF